MFKTLKAVAGILVSLCLFLSAAYGQQPADYLDHIRIIAIKSMEVERTEYDTFLNMVIQIHNTNPQNIKIYDGTFKFYLQLNDGEKNLLGVDTVKRDIILESAALLKNREITDAEFKINITSNQEKVAVWMLNTIGNPAKYAPTLYIDGEFKLGIESDKGWTTFPQIINWVFEPDIHRFVLLEKFHGFDIMKMTIEEIVIFLIKMQCYSQTAMMSNAVPNDFKAFLLINFDFDSAKIRKESFVYIDKLGSAMKQCDKKLMIVGHTCDLGREDYNLRLSEKRAKAVEDYLITKHKISPDRLKITGLGEKYAGPNDTPERRAINRRVEFICVDE